MVEHIRDEDGGNIRSVHKHIHNVGAKWLGKHYNMTHDNEYNKRLDRQSGQLQQNHIGWTAARSHQDDELVAHSHHRVGSHHYGYLMAYSNHRVCTHEYDNIRKTIRKTPKPNVLMVKI